NFDFDTRTVRPYFPYERVRQGVLDVTGRLFGVTFRAIKDAPVWHSSVEAYDAVENGSVIGRVYLDTHRRPNKLNASSLATAVRTGLAGRSLPEGVLIMSVPGGEAGDPGLLSIEEVRAFFHEFGHLLAGIFAGRGKWFGLVRPAERDFVETAAQMLEE